MDNIFFNLKELKHLGNSIIIGKTVRIRKPESVSIDDGSIIDDFTYISCALEIGKYSHIAPNVTISGGSSKVTMGNFVGIAAGVSIHAQSSEYISASLDLPSIPKRYRIGGIDQEITISDHVIIGAKSTVLPGVVLPEGFASAANSVVPKGTYDSWTLYGGSPIKKICVRKKDKILEIAGKILQDNK